MFAVIILIMSIQPTEKEGKKKETKKQAAKKETQRTGRKEAHESRADHDLIPRKKLLLEREKRRELEEENQILKKELIAERQMCRKLQEELFEKRGISS